jgi:hypothetical protein
VFVRAYLENNDNFGVYGRVIAEVEAQDNNYSSSSDKIYFPPNNQTIVVVEIGDIDSRDYNYFSGQKYLLPTIRVETEGGSCPYCSGTGFMTCPDCTDNTNDGGENGYDPTTDGGTSDYNPSTGGGTSEYRRRGTTEDTAFAFPLDLTILGVGVAAAVVIGAIVVTKRKKVSEKDLRKLTPVEFQNWVIQRISGKSASATDSRIGIDGYTTEGYPIKIKQSEDVDRNAIENFASLMGRIKAKNGVIVAFSFSENAIRGIVRARVNYRVEIRKVSVKELIERRGMI